MVFTKELKKLGLKDKEAAVYVACLELGPSPVQTISRKAKVVRATTYVILDSLSQQGLVTQYKEGKKTLFSAEPPSQLVRLLDREEEAIKDRKQGLEKLLPQLQAIMKSSDKHPTVRYFDGVEGLRSIRREMLMYSQPGDTWYNFTPIDHIDAVLKQDQDSYYNQRNAKRIKSKTIFSSRSPALKKKILSAYDNQRIEQRYVSSKVFPMTSGLTVYRDRVAIGSFSGHIGGVIIESQEMAEMIKRLFEIAWIAVEGLDHENNSQ